jgi:AcrR family transcriptional regulator
MEERRGQGVRVEDVAKAAQVSRQAVYLHFTSRAGLLKATLDYVEEVTHFMERIAPVFGKSGAEGVDALVDFWGAFVRDTYGISKAFLAARVVDADVEAAWDDKMAALYQGCLAIMRCSARDQVLAPGWTAEAAADFLWTIISIENWEHLTLERGWSQADYLARIKDILKQVLVILA